MSLGAYAIGNSGTAFNVNLTNVVFDECLRLPLNSGAIDQILWIARVPMVLIEASYIHSTAGTDGGAVTLQITKDTGTTAPGAGTALLTSAFNCKGTANTLQIGSLVTTVATRTLAAGDRLGLDFTGTTTSLAGIAISFRLQLV